MLKQDLLIDNIPAILWGEPSTRLFVAVHGNLSNKADAPIRILAETAVALGYQVLSFDLPEHGDRKTDPTPCKVQNCVADLNNIMHFAQTKANNIHLFACSMGAYFSLLAYKEIPLQQSLFLSPVVNMNRIITNMMTWFGVSEEHLRQEQEIATPVGQTLYWDYYCYVQENPIVSWHSPTAILYGKQDTLCEFEFVSAFAKQFDCSLEVLESGEHYFHTPAQFAFFKTWLQEHIYQ